MELRCPDSTPSHNKQVNSASTLSPEPPRPGDQIPNRAGGNSASTAKRTPLTGHAHSSVPAKWDPRACDDASLNSESDGGGGNFDLLAGYHLLGDCVLSQQIGAQLKLLPMNDQIRELQTIIRDKWALSRRGKGGGGLSGDGRGLKIL